MADSNKPKPGGVHAGHRGRMRQRFLQSGLTSFQDHEVLEFLLFYAVPRRDVNEMAHLLLDRFGTLAGVLNAPEEELRDIVGVGPRVSHFLNLVPQLIVQMARQSQRGEPLFLRTPQDAAAFLAQYPVAFLPGQVLLVLTDLQHKVLAVHPYQRFEDLTIRELASQCANSRAALCVLLERVADCDALAPPSQLSALDQLSRQLKTLDTPLWDFFSVDELGHPPRSFARTGQLLPC